MSITENLEKLLASGQDNAMLRFGLGSGYFNDKDYVSAIPHLRACIEQDPNYSAAYKLLGKALFKTGDHLEAKSVFKSGLPVAVDKGDRQTEREILAFLGKIDRETAES